MTYNVDLRLIPPLIQDFGSGLLNEQNASEIRENYAQRLENIRDYCTEMLERFEISKRKKIAVSKIPRRKKSA